MVSKKVDNKKPKSYFLSEKEKDVFQKLVPQEYYNNCDLKYKTIENQVNEIKKKLKENDKIKSDISLVNLQNDEIQTEIKKQELAKLKLLKETNKYNKDILDLKGQIKQVNGNINKYDMILNIKMRENDIIKKNMETSDKKN